MPELKVLFSILLLTCLKAQSQPLSTPKLADDLKKLVAINSTISWTTFANKEGKALYDSASAAQLIEITAPYLNSETHNARSLCWSLLSNAMFKKTENDAQKQQLVEVLCKNYLQNEYDVEMVDLSLITLKEKDFSPEAKRYVAVLEDNLDSFSYASCAKLLAVAQIKKSIPALWKRVNTDNTTMRLSDLDVLASLARMGEKRAGKLLCNYYNSIRGKTGDRHISAAINLAFSLDMAVLNCLVADYKTLDINIHYRDGDVFVCPTCRLGVIIVSMIKNYPYPKNGFSVDINKLLEWLNQSPVFELESK